MPTCPLCGPYLDRAVVMTFAAFGVVQMSFHQVVGVVAVRDRFMAASGSMLVSLFVTAAIVPRRARCGVTGVDGDHMLIHMRFMQMVQMSIVDVVGVPLMLDRGVSATRAVLMRMAVVNVA
jgi:hypothetical protein